MATEGWLMAWPRATATEWGVVALTALIIMLTLCLHGHLVYGDWTCGFANCVKVKDVHR